LMGLPGRSQYRVELPAFRSLPIPVRSAISSGPLTHAGDCHGRVGQSARRTRGEDFSIGSGSCRNRFGRSRVDLAPTPGCAYVRDRASGRRALDPFGTGAARGCDGLPGVRSPPIKLMAGGVLLGGPQPAYAVLSIPSGASAADFHSTSDQSTLITVAATLGIYTKIASVDTANP
jgi:hypothetical protein